VRTGPANGKVWSKCLPQLLVIGGAQLRPFNMLREKLQMHKSIVVIQGLKPLSLGVVRLAS